MKICAIICEFNPFHNGHKYIIEQAKDLSGCDKILCIMSGNFTQRGDVCISDKYTRAKHAVSGGADCVLELPAAFAVAPAEIFAKGAIKIAASIPAVKCVAFGAENNDKKAIANAAQVLSSENELFKQTLSENLKTGKSYIKSYAEAFTRVGGNAELISSPNNILGTEYTKAILKMGADIDILPVKRIGSGYSDGKIQKNYSSASAIRENLTSPMLASNVPEYVIPDLLEFSTLKAKFEEQLLHSLLWTTTEDLRKIYGCSEGLENALKNAINGNLKNIVENCTSKRYSTSRINRILCANLLKLYSCDCENYLSSTLYLNPMAVRKNCSAELLSALAESPFPLIIRGRDRLKLCKTALKCLKSDEKAHLCYCLMANKQPKNSVQFI